MDCLIIGYGSIGARHAGILKELGCQISLVTARKIADFPCYSTISQALDAHAAHYVIISNETYLHYETLLTLIKLSYRGIVLIEKPLFTKMEMIVSYPMEKILVAYHYRFHELLNYAKKIIAQDKLLSFSAYVGQYLPTWRPHTDYRQSYSAKKWQGGGVLRDLSHELDYSVWFCGNVLRLTALGGKYSPLEIDSDDIFSILLECTHCPIVNLQLNYLDRQSRREIIIHTSTQSIFIDLLKGQLSVNGELKLNIPDAKTKAYYRQHEALLQKEFSTCCDLTEGLTLMKYIEAIENAAHSQKWIHV